VIYLLILLALLACMVAIDGRFRLFFFARPRAAAIVMVVGLAFFLIWDAVAIAGAFSCTANPRS